MKFDHFQFLRQQVMNQAQSGEGSKTFSGQAERLNPIVLAYIGDAYFSLYVRTRLLVFEANKVRVIHSFGAQMVSAAAQAAAVKTLEKELSEEEWDVVRRGRNSKSSSPRSASVSEYRYSTGFEALIGYLYLSEKYDRLTEIVEKAFDIISQEIKILEKI